MAAGGYLDYIRKTYKDRATDFITQATNGLQSDPTAGTGYTQMVYPQDLFSPESAPFVLFFAVHPTKVNVVIDKIALYMPRNLEVDYGINYSEATNYYNYLPSSWSQASDDAATIVNRTLSLGGLAAAGAGAMAGGRAGSGLWGKLSGALAGAGAGLLGASSRSNSVGQTININQKTTLNPHLASTFEGVNFRRHPFQFELVARNAEESETINQIIYTFKYHGHPVAGPDNKALFQNWPSSWQIGLFSPARKYLYNISTCQLTNMRVNYSSGGSRAFFADTGAPVSVTLSLEFVETELLTRERIKQGY